MARSFGHARWKGKRKIRLHPITKFTEPTTRQSYEMHSRFPISKPLTPARSSASRMVACCKDHDNHWRTYKPDVRGSKVVEHATTPSKSICSFTRTSRGAPTRLVAARRTMIRPPIAVSVLIETTAAGRHHFLASNRSWIGGIWKCNGHPSRGEVP